MVAGIVLSGCVVTAEPALPRGIVVSGPPPAAREEPHPTAPSPQAAWVSGYWHWTGASYTWIPGHWEAAPPGERWYAPHYVKGGDGRYYYEPGAFRGEQ